MVRQIIFEVFVDASAVFDILFVMSMASGSDSLREFAFNAGLDNPDRQWLLDGRDVWVQNPHYHGPAQPHPEDDLGDDEPHGSHDLSDDAEALASAGHGMDEDYYLDASYEDRTEMDFMD